MTETSPVSCQSDAETPLAKRVSTVGRVQPHLEVKIIDPETGADVHVVATVGAVDEESARIDLKVTTGDTTVLVKAQLRVAVR